MNCITILPTRLYKPYFPSTFLRLRRRRHLFKPFSSATATDGADPPPFFHHGPSLSRGRPPPPVEPQSIDRESVSRSFDIAALRVPAAECSALERRLRGHLLNWPRVRNVARVPGDDLDPSLDHLLRRPHDVDPQRLASLSRSPTQLSDSESDSHHLEGLVLSPVLYREKLSREFNCRGFLNFRNLAKISRPKQKRKNVLNKTEIKLDTNLKNRSRKSGIYVVEVAEDDDEDDMKGLLGEDFIVRRNWKGPTRLLLLDEQYANKSIDELPTAVKVVLQGDTSANKPSVFELVQCRLTLFYDYWQMTEVLEALLPEGILIPSGFETVGHIAHLNLRNEHLPYKNVIAQVVLDKNKTKIKTVVNKIDAIQNDYRTMELEVLAGNHSLVTTVVENGIRFQVDLAAVYWNSRLATERQRLISGFTNTDVVCDVFSGCGPIAISAAKKVKYVYANDLNPTAVEYLERNIVLNKLERKIEVFNMDGRRFVEAIFAIRRTHRVSQVVMNLPTDAAEFLDAFRGILRRDKENGFPLPRIHVYGFSKAQDPEFDFQERIYLALCETLADIEMHRVRLVAPGKWMLCASFILPKSVAVGK